MFQVPVVRAQVPVLNSPLAKMQIKGTERTDVVEERQLGVMLCP